MKRSLFLTSSALALASILGVSASHAQQAAPASSAVIAAPAGASTEVPLDERRAAFAKGGAFLKGMVRPGADLDTIVAKLLKPTFEQLDADHNAVLDAKDQEAATALMTVAVRANRVGRFLTLDLDGDGKVTKAEVEEALKRQPALGFPAALKNAEDKIMTADLNHDGVIDYDEMRKLGPEDMQIISENNRVASILALFPGQGSVDEAALEKKVRDFYASIGFAHEHVVTQADMQELASSPQAAKVATPVPVAAPKQ